MKKERFVPNFDDYTFRSHSAWMLMVKPKGGTPMDKYLSLKKEADEKKLKVKEKLDKAKEKLETLEDKKHTKAYENQDALVKKYTEELSNVSVSYNSQLKELEKDKDKIVLSETTIKYLIGVYNFVKNGRRRNVTNRYVEKGLKVEDKAITLLSDVDDQFYDKNTERKRDAGNNIEGECDIRHVFRINGEEVKVVIDTKSSWDSNTFEANMSDGNNVMYEWQGQCYMEIEDAELFIIAYCLIDTPEGIIEDECKRFLYQLGSNMKDSVEYKQGCEEIRFNSIYPDIPEQERVIRKYIRRDREKIKDLFEQIAICRKWLNQYAIDRDIIAYETPIEKMIGQTVFTVIARELEDGEKLKSVNHPNQIEEIEYEDVKGSDISNFEKAISSVVVETVTATSEESQFVDGKRELKDEERFHEQEIPFPIENSSKPENSHTPPPPPPTPKKKYWGFDVDKESYIELDEDDYKKPKFKFVPLGESVKGTKEEAVELHKKLIKTNEEENLPNKYTPPLKDEVIQGFNKEQSEILEKMKSITSFEKCIKFYQENIRFFQDEANSEIRAKLTDIRESFKPKQQTDKASSKEEKPKQSTPPPPPTAAAAPPPQPVTQEQPNITEEKVMILLKICKTRQEVKDLHEKYKTFINSIPELRQKCVDYGKSLKQ